MKQIWHKSLCVLSAAAMVLGMGVLTSAETYPESSVQALGASDKTIIEFRSDGKNEVQAHAGDTVPVMVYVPQSTGICTVSLKMSINGSETLGVGVEEKPEDLEKIRQDCGDPSLEHWLYGNYGIKTANEKFATPFCFDSGIYQDGWGGGDPALSMSYFQPNKWNISLTLSTFINNNSNADAYAPYKAALGDGNPDDFDYEKYTPVTAWSKDEPWAYDYALATFDLVLPENLEDGVYTLDVLREKYINTVSHMWAQSSVDSIDGKQEFETIPLRIVVGNVGETTAPATTTAETTTTTVTTTTTTVTTASGALKGDLNGDGNVNLKDVVLLRRSIAGGWNVTVDDTLADVSGDGKVNLKDVVLLRRQIADS